MISVAMASYNGEKYIEEQIESIMNQKLPVDEIVIVDDCSTDNTVKIIEKIRNNSNVEINLFVNEKNVGYIENFRRAVEKTKGDVIFLSDQDDIWYEDKTKRMIHIMENKDVEVLCTQYDIIDSKGKYISSDDLRFNGNMECIKDPIANISFLRLLFGNAAPGCTYCFTKHIKQLYLRKVKNPIIHDYAICLIGAALGKLYMYNGKTIKYRLHENNNIGIDKKNEKQKLELKGRKKPYLIAFLEDYYDIMKKSDKVKAKVILYLRIPAIKVICRNFLIGIRERFRRG